MLNINCKELLVGPNIDLLQYKNRVLETVWTNVARSTGMCWAKPVVPRQSAVPAEHTVQSRQSFRNRVKWTYRTSWIHITTVYNRNCVLNSLLCIEKCKPFNLFVRKSRNKQRKFLIHKPCIFHCLGDKRPDVLATPNRTPIFICCDVLKKF